MFRRKVACIGAMVLVACALSASSAAAALPEFTGPFPKTFAAKSTKSVFATVGGRKTNCLADSGAGELTGPQKGVIQLTFTGCHMGRIPCFTPGLPSGTIGTGTLAMQVGYINKAKKEVGADLTEPAGLPLVSYFCGTGLRVYVIGSVIGKLKPVNKPVTPAETFLLHFAQTAGLQKPLNLEGEPPDFLETSFGGPYEQTGFASADLLKFAEVVELKA